MCLNEIGRDNIKIVGTKGANLGELIRLAIPVPEGFVITTLSFDIFASTSNLNEMFKKVLDGKETRANLLQYSDKLKGIALSYDIPDKIKNKIIESYLNLISINDSSKNYDNRHSLVAIRSSAAAEDLSTASFAGQYSSFLNLNGIDQVIDSIKKCWASLFEPNAIAYCRKNRNFENKIAVVV